MQVKIVPRNASNPGQAQPIPAPLPHSALLPAQAPEFPVQYSGAPAAGSSSQPLQPVATQRAFPRRIQSSIDRIVKGLLFSSHREDARAQIEGKLRSFTEAEQMTLLMYLTTLLSGKANDAQPRIIQTWATEATIATATAGRDMRTDSQKYAENAIAAQERDAAFKTPRDQILSMLPGKHRSDASVKSASATATGLRFHSPLYLRVFNDSRGPVAAINDIHALIKDLLELHRWEAILEWKCR